MAKNVHIPGDNHFGIYLLPPKESNGKFRYSISPSFKDAMHFAADFDARTVRQGQVSAGIFTNVSNDFYRLSVSVVADLNSRKDLSLPVFDDKRHATIDDMLGYEIKPA